MDLLITIGVIVATIAVAFGALRQKIIDIVQEIKEERLRREKQYDERFKTIEKQCEEKFNLQQDMLKEIRIDIKMMLLREREYSERDK